MNPTDYESLMRRLRRHSVPVLMVGIVAVGSLGLLVHFSPSVQAALGAFKDFLEGNFGDGHAKACIVGLSGGIVGSIPMLLCIWVVGCFDRKHGARCGACGKSVTGAGLLQLVNQRGECFHCKAQVLTS